MPRKKYPAHPVRDAFSARLRAFYTDCGSPKSTLIIAMAAQLKNIYADVHGLGSLPTLSKTAISETLNGHRKTLPDPAWVACFILSCQRFAYEAGILPTDPGRSILPDWQTALRNAEDEAQRLGLPLRRGPRAPAAARPPVAPIDPAVMFGVVPPPRQPDRGPHDATDGAPDVTGPIQLIDRHHEHVASYGRYGRTLLERALAQDPHALYQLAVLLAADPDRSDQAIALLTDAAATGQPQALTLLQASPRQLDHRLTATHAHELAKAAQNAGFLGAALTFHECSARFNPSNTPIAAPAAADDNWP